MGGSERTWGSKGRASWKVTLSSRRWVLYRFGLPHPVLPFLGLVHHPLSRSHIFFFPAILSVFAFAEALALRLDIFHAHLRSLRPPFLPPLFFSHGNSNFPLSSSLFRPPTLAPPSIGIFIPPFHSSIPPPIPFFRALSSHSYGIRGPLLDLRPVSAPGDPPTSSFLPCPHSHFIPSFLQTLSGPPQLLTQSCHHCWCPISNF